MYLTETRQPKLVAPVFHLDCTTGCAPMAPLPPLCNKALEHAISNARSLALNAAQRLEANPRSTQVVNEFRRFFDHDPGQSLPWPGLRDSGLRFARRYRAVAEALLNAGTLYRCDNCLQIRSEPPASAILDVHAIALPPNEVLLCPSFWQLPRFQMAGVILHEMFHLRFDPCFVHGACETKRTSAYCYEGFAMTIAKQAPEQLVLDRCTKLKK